MLDTLCWLVLFLVCLHAIDEIIGCAEFIAIFLGGMVETIISPLWVAISFFRKKWRSRFA